MISALAPTAPHGWVKTTPSRSCSPNPSNSPSSGVATPPTSISKDELLSSRDECMRVIYQVPGQPRPRGDPCGRRVRSSEFPAAEGARSRHRRRDRGQLPGRAPRAARLEGPRADRQGAAAEPGRLHRPRVQLHLPGRPLARDDGPDRRQRAPVRGARRAHRLRRHRGGTYRGAHGGAAPPDGVRKVVGHRRRRARDARRDQGARPLRRRERRRRGLLLEGCGRGGLAARGHAHARGGPEGRRAHGLREHRGDRHRHRGRARDARVHRPR